MSMSLLTTKLYFPPMRSILVSRRHLMERLQIGLKGRLTLVSAPAGYGKTTLMSEWRAGLGRDISTAWLSLDDDDNDLTRFLMYIIAALASLKPGFGEITLGLLQLLPPLSTQVILTSLINELGEFDKTFALILDDYHTITNHTVHEAVTYLLDHLPSQMHLVILTRADPPLPLSRLRARNQLVEIRAENLRLTVEEAATFLSQVMGLTLSKDQVGALEQRTEGWVAGLQLAALTMQGRDDVQDFVSAFTGSHHYIVDYLVEEVLDRQSQSMREFLLKTSILDKLTAPLCNALTNHSNGQAVLENLEHANLFVVPLDDERCWYRYHHLFADVLRNRLQQTLPASLSELHQRAASWCKNHDLISEAVSHALACGDIELAAVLIEQNAGPMMKRSELVTLLNWIEAVKPLVRERPWLAIVQAWIFTYTGQLNGVEPLLQSAEHCASESSITERENVLGNIAAIRAYVAALQENATRAIDLAQQALDLLPESSDAIRSVVSFVLGGAYRLRGNVSGARHAWVEARRTSQTAGNIYLSVSATSALADLFIEQGWLHQAAETYQEALRLATNSDGRRLPVAARALAGLSGVFYEWNDLEEAVHCASESIELCRLWGNADSQIAGHLMMARIWQAQGDLSNAQEAMSIAEQIAYKRSLRPGSASRVESARLRLLLSQGNLESLVRWTEEMKDQAGERDFDQSDRLSCMLIRIFLAQGEYDKALSSSERLLLRTETAQQIGLVIELFLLQSMAYQGKQDLAHALVALKHALELAEPHGFMRVFLDEGAPMIQLLIHARSRGFALHYITKLISGLSKTGAALPDISQPLIEPLSDRELEVLRLVAEGKSNQQIADALIIARGTVKKHLNNIFGKLGAQNRTQCVARARELDLL